MENGPRTPELSREVKELLENPEKVFDGDIERAEEENHDVIERLTRLGEISREGNEASIQTIQTIEAGNLGIPPAIEIFWDKKPGAPATLLRLNPIFVGRGAESGANLGYTGSYGVATSEGRNYKFADGEKIKSLEKVFAVPDGLKLIVRPTIDVWMMSKNPLDRATFGDNARTLYMGLGFLFLGREWMFVGMHEAGHLTHADENAAWRVGNSQYAKINRPRKKAIIAGEDTGEFDILKRPTNYGKSLTAGRIMQYGLTCHWLKNDAKLPEIWRKERTVKQTIDEFRQIIKKANEEYDHFIGR